VPDENDLSKYNDGSTAVVTVITPNKIVYVGNLGNSRAVMSNLDRESQRIIIQAGRNPENYNVSVLLMTLKRSV
jgi:serine/threonine protein phosphatase PrpC